MSKSEYGPLSKNDLLDEKSKFRFECVVNSCISAEIHINYLHQQYQKIIELNPNLILPDSNENFMEINRKVADIVKERLDDNFLEDHYDLAIENRSVIFDEKDGYVKIIYPDRIKLKINNSD